MPTEYTKADYKKKGIKVIEGFGINESIRIAKEMAKTNAGDISKAVMDELTESMISMVNNPNTADTPKVRALQAIAALLEHKRKSAETLINIVKVENEIVNPQDQANQTINITVGNEDNLDDLERIVNAAFLKNPDPSTK